MSAGSQFHCSMDTCWPEHIESFPRESPARVFSLIFNSGAGAVVSCISQVQSSKSPEEEEPAQKELNPFACQPSVGLNCFLHFCFFIFIFPLAGHTCPDNSVLFTFAASKKLWPFRGPQHGALSSGEGSVCMRRTH